MTPSGGFRRAIVDRALLLVTAIFVGASLLALMILVGRYTPATREWFFFVGGSIVYNGTALYLVSRTTLRRLSTLSHWGLAVVTLEMPLVLFFTLVYLGTISAPQSIFPYWLGSILIAPVMVEVVRLMFRM